MKNDNFLILTPCLIFTSHKKNNRVGQVRFIKWINGISFEVICYAIYNTTVAWHLQTIKNVKSFHTQR